MVPGTGHDAAAVRDIAASVGGTERLAMVPGTGHDAAAVRDIAASVGGTERLAMVPGAGHDAAAVGDIAASDGGTELRAAGVAGWRQVAVDQAPWRNPETALERVIDAR